MKFKLKESIDEYLNEGQSEIDKKIRENGSRDDLLWSVSRMLSYKDWYDDNVEFHTEIHKDGSRWIYSDSPLNDNDARRVTGYIEDILIDRYDMNSQDFKVIRNKYGSGWTILFKDSKLKESGNPFKSHHICKGCGKPLDQCTCKVDDEDKVNEDLTVGESLNDSIAVKMSRDDFDRMCREGGILKGLNSRDYIEVRDSFNIGYEDFDAAVNDLWAGDDSYHSREWYANLLRKYTNSIKKSADSESLKESLNLNEVKNIINVLNKNLGIWFKHSAGGIFSLDRTPFNEDTFNKLIKNNYKMIGDILEEQGLKYDISEDAYISKDENLYVTIYGGTGTIIVQFDEMESESLKEDWRDGKFTEDDFNKYVDKTMDNVNHILTSISFMKRKHSEYAELFDNLVSEIIDKFEGVILLKEDLDKSKNNSEEDILDEVSKLLPSEVKIEHDGPTTSRGLTFDLFKIEGPTGSTTGTCVYLKNGEYDVSLTNSSEGKFPDAKSIARFFADHYNIRM